MTRWLLDGLKSPSPILLSYVGALAIFAIVSLYSPGFASPSHIATLIVVASFTGIVAIGQTMVIIGGGIDLSVPWLLNCAATATTALTSSHDAALVWAVPMILVGAAAIGSLNGLGIALLRVPPIVMTLSTNVILLGLLFIVTRGFPPPPTPLALQWIANGRIGALGGLPVMLFVWLALAVIVLVVERRTSFGRYLYAVGSSRTVAQLSGVPVVGVTIMAYAISGLTAGIAGILLTGYAKQSYLGMGEPYSFTSIAAVAIGGASILGGSGSYLGTIAGALVLTLLTGVLPIFRLDAGALKIIYGAVILVTVAIASPQLRALFRRN
jgi:ribose transport system permease protein